MAVAMFGLALAPLLVLAGAGSIQVNTEERGVLAIVVGVNGPFSDSYRRFCKTEATFRDALFGTTHSLRKQMLEASYGQLDFAEAKSKLLWDVRIQLTSAEQDECSNRMRGMRAAVAAMGLEPARVSSLDGQGFCASAYESYETKDTADHCNVICACDPRCSHVTTTTYMRSGRDRFICQLHASLPTDCTTSSRTTLGTFKIDKVKTASSAKITVDGFCHYFNNDKTRKETGGSNHVLFVYDETDCSSTGYTSGFGNMGTYFATADGCKPSSITHEIGHTLGLHHANSDLADAGRGNGDNSKSYGDGSDLMAGFGNEVADVMGQMGSTLRGQAGWFRAFPHALRSITPSYTDSACKQRYMLTAVGENPADDTSAPAHVISFPRPEHGYYHVSYRPADPETFDRDLPTKYADTIQVHYTTEHTSEWLKPFEYGGQDFWSSNLVGWATASAGGAFTSKGTNPFTITWPGRSAALADVASGSSSPFTTEIEIDFCSAGIEEVPPLCVQGSAGCVEECETVTTKPAAFAEEWGDTSDYGGGVWTDSSDLELFGESDGSDHRYVALQYSNVKVPAGAVVKAASIAFTVDEHPKTSEQTKLSVRIEAEGAWVFAMGDGTGGSEKFLKVTDTKEDCKALVITAEPAANGATWGTTNRKCFAEYAMSGRKDNDEYVVCRLRSSALQGCGTLQDCDVQGDLSTRALSTEAAVTWTLQSVDASGDTVGDTVTTPDISSMVQSLVDGAAWGYRSNLPTFLFSRASGSGTRTFDSGGSPPVLTVSYCRLNQHTVATTTATAKATTATTTCTGTCDRMRGQRKIDGGQRRGRLRRAASDDDGREYCPGR